METSDPDFSARFARFIEVANGYLATTQPTAVSISMNEAAARFSAWVHAAKSPSLEAMTDGREAATQYYLDQCRVMFQAHYDDYVQNFDRFQNQGKNG